MIKVHVVKEVKWSDGLLLRLASIFIFKKKPQELAAASLVEGEVPFKQLPKKLVEIVEKFTEKLDLEKQLEYLSVMTISIYQ